MDKPHDVSTRETSKLDNSPRRTPTEIKFNYDTIEDHHPTMQAAAAIKDGLLVVVQNLVDPRSPITEILTVNAVQDKLVHFRHDSSSSSGWTKDEQEILGDLPSGVPKKVERLSAFYAGNVLYTSCNFASMDPNAM